MLSHVKPKNVWELEPKSSGHLQTRCACEEINNYNMCFANFTPKASLEN